MTHPLTRILPIAIISACLLGCEGSTDSALEASGAKEKVLLTPNDSDRYSQLTGTMSNQSRAIVNAIEKNISEDGRYTATFLITQPAYINIQLDNTGNTTTEVFTMDDESYNRFAISEGIEALSFSPIRANWTSEWTLLQAGRYHTSVDNTDRGSVQPPWNGINDYVRFKLSILASPAYNDGTTPLQNDFPIEEDTRAAKLLQLSSVQLIDDKGY